MKLRLLPVGIGVLQITISACSVSEVYAWKQKSIDGSIFDDPLLQTETIAAQSEIHCALLATKFKWPNVLYFTNEICHLASVDVYSPQNEIFQGPSAVEGKLLYKSKISELVKKSSHGFLTITCLCLRLLRLG